MTPVQERAMWELLIDTTEDVDVRMRALTALKIGRQVVAGDGTYARLIRSDSDMRLREELASEVEQLAPYPGDAEARSAAAAFREETNTAATTSTR